MTNRYRASLCVLLAFNSVSGRLGESKTPATKTALLLALQPTKSVYALGTDITLEFTFKNVSPRRVLATRGAGLEDVTFLSVIDERGRKVPWQGVLPATAYPNDFFVVLEPGQSVSFRQTISSSYKQRGKRGLGAAYQIENSGSYRVQAVFSLAPRAYFAPVSNGAVVPEHPVFSNWARFSVVQK